MRSSRSPLGALVLALTLGVTARAGAVPRSFEVVASAPITTADRATSRQRAVDEALRAAVELAAQSLSTPAELAARATELRLRILPRAPSFIVKYQVIEEGEAEGGMYQVKLSAAVALDRLGRALRQAATPQPVEPGPARVVVGCIAGGAAAEAARQRLGELLVERGIELLPVAGACEEPAVLALGRARARSGQVVGGILGELELKSEGAVRGPVGIEGSSAGLRLRFLDPEGGSLGQVEAAELGYGAGASEAERVAARSAVETAWRLLEPKISRRASASQGGGVVAVSVLGITSYADFRQLVRAFEANLGVEHVAVLRFVRGGAELSVRTSAGAARLAEALARTPLENARMIVQVVGEAALSVRLDQTGGDGG